MLGLIINPVGAIVTAAISVTKALAAAGLAIEGLKGLCNAVVGLAKALGLIKPENTADTLGDKAFQAEEAGMKPENFNTYEEYVRAVEKFEVDPEKTKLHTEEERVLKGAELAAGVAIEAFPHFAVENFLKLIAEKPDYFTEARMTELGEIGKKSPDIFSEVLGYLDGSLREDGAMGRAIDTLVGMEKAVNPEASDREALKTVLNARKDG